MPKDEEDDVALAQAVRAAVLAVPGVLGISPGVGYVEATYGRGKQVEGVGVRTEHGRIVTNVHLIIAETPIPALARRARATIRRTIEGTSAELVGPINLYIDDMQLSGTRRSEERAR